MLEICARVYRFPLPSRFRFSPTFTGVGVGQSGAPIPRQAVSRSIVWRRSTRPAAGTHSSTSWRISLICSSLCSEVGGRRTRRELEIETPRSAYVLLCVHSTASSDGRPLIVNLMSAESGKREGGETHGMEAPPSTALRMSGGSSRSWYVSSWSVGGKRTVTRFSGRLMLSTSLEIDESQQQRRVHRHNQTRLHMGGRA